MFHYVSKILVFISLLYIVFECRGHYYTLVVIFVKYFFDLKIFVKYLTLSISDNQSYT